MKYMCLIVLMLIQSCGNFKLDKEKDCIKLLSDAEVKLSERNFQKALEVLSIAQKRSCSDKAHIYNLVGNAFFGLKDYERALSAFLLTQSIDSTITDINFNIGLTLIKLEKPKKAIGFLKSQINIAPYEPSSYILLGDSYLLSGDTGSAIYYYKIASEILPDPEVLNNIGFLEMKNGNLLNALEFLNKSIELGFDNPRVFYNRGEVQLLLGDTSSAEEDFKKARLLEY